VSDILSDTAHDALEEPTHEFHDMAGNEAPAMTVTETDGKVAYYGESEVDMLRVSPSANDSTTDNQMPINAAGVSAPNV